MTKRGMRGIYSMLGLGALGFMSVAVANAQVTVTSVKVTVSGPLQGGGTSTAVYCDTSLLCGATGGIEVWPLPAGGQLVNPNETMVLTQTALLPNIGGNFDTSDRVRAVPGLQACDSENPCTVTIEINGQQVYNNGGPNPLNFNNADDSSTTTNEAHDWVPAADKPNYTLKLGYADNAHSDPCPETGCFPNPFDSLSGHAATYFFGAGGAAEGSCPFNCYDAGALLITGKLAPVTGRMTGGGSVFTPDGTRVTHGFEIHCDITDVPNTLEVNWPAANNFHMDTLTYAKCTDDPSINQKPPNSSTFDTFVGIGSGKLNGEAGATIEFTFVDAGEPGTSDTATYIIKDKLGNVVYTVPVAPLIKGNHQAHK